MFYKATWYTFPHTNPFRKPEKPWSLWRYLEGETNVFWTKCFKLWDKSDRFFEQTKIIVTSNYLSVSCFDRLMRLTLEVWKMPRSHSNNLSLFVLSFYMWFCWKARWVGRTSQKTVFFHQRHQQEEVIPLKPDFSRMKHQSSVFSFFFKCFFKTNGQNQLVTIHVIMVLLEKNTSELFLFTVQDGPLRSL